MNAPPKYSTVAIFCNPAAKDKFKEEYWQFDRLVVIDGSTEIGSKADIAMNVCTCIILDEIFEGDEEVTEDDVYCIAYNGHTLDGRQRPKFILPVEKILALVELPSSCRFAAIDASLLVEGLQPGACPLPVAASYYSSETGFVRCQPIHLSSSNPFNNAYENCPTIMGKARRELKRLFKESRQQRRAVERMIGEFHDVSDSVDKIIAHVKQINHTEKLLTVAHENDGEICEDSVEIEDEGFVSDTPVGGLAFHLALMKCITSGEGKLYYVGDPGPGTPIVEVRGWDLTPGKAIPIEIFTLRRNYDKSRFPEGVQPKYVLAEEIDLGELPASVLRKDEE